MNTTEQIVEAYFRLCRKCFTYPDLKVEKGNNRQIDLLAVNLASGDQYHIETGVSHQPRWNKTVDELHADMRRKFLGMPQERAGKRTDHARGKSYYRPILDTYRTVGFDPGKVRRVWVCWTIDGGERAVADSQILDAEGNPLGVSVISMRDEVLPKLQEDVATSHYDDHVLRTLSLLKQMDTQLSRE